MVAAFIGDSVIVVSVLKVTAGVVLADGVEIGEALVVPAVVGVSVRVVVI